MAGGKSLQELGLKDEPLPVTDLSDLPEFGSYTPPPQPGTYRFKLPANLTQVYDVLDTDKGQRLKVVFDSEHPLVIVQAPAHRQQYLQTTFQTSISGKERPRGKDKVEVSDLQYLLKAVGIQKVNGNRDIVAQLSTKGGGEFTADITYSYGCSADRFVYLRDPNDPSKLLKCDGVEYAEQKGCGRRYYQDKDVPKDANGNYPLEHACECGAVVRGFANLDRIRA